ncbi:ribonuclease P protein component, partial [candidate division KSB1 bacterium]
RIRGSCVTVYYLLSEKMSFAVLAKKKTGSAVERNKIKRWVREIYRQERGLLSRPVDLIVMADKSCSLLDHNNLREDIIRIFNKI